MRGLRSELGFLVEQLLIALAALLPGRSYFYALRLLGRLHFFFVDLQPAADKLHAWMPSRCGRKEALRGLALHRLVDMADFYLTVFKGQRWFEGNVVIDAPANLGPGTSASAMMYTFHYGQGFWVLPYFRSLGWECAFLHLSPPLISQAPWGERLAAWFGHLRIAQVARLSNASAITTGGSRRRMRERLLDEQQAVLVMPDVPGMSELPSLPVILFDRPARFPAGTIELAINENVPVYIYTMVLDRRSGLRHLRICGPFEGDTPPKLADRLAGVLEEAIQSDPTGWHLWAWIDHFVCSDELKGAD